MGGQLKPVCGSLNEVILWWSAFPVPVYGVSWTAGGDDQLLPVYGSVLKSWVVGNCYLSGFFKLFISKQVLFGTWLGQDQDYLGESPEWLYRYLLLL
jgi:hypothetical protein